MLSPAKERLAKAVSAGSITQGQADRRLERLEQLVARLVSKTFPAKS
jgi:predicted RNA-binding protein associated with RNAse of E/G family